MSAKTDTPMEGILSVDYFDLNAEAMVLSTLLLDGVSHRIYDVYEEYFYDPKNKYIYEVMKRIYDEGLPLDIITIYSRIKDAGKGKDYLDHINIIADLALSDASLGTHIEILRNKYNTRKMITAFNCASDRMKSGESAENAASYMMDSIIGIYKESHGNRIVGMEKAIEEALKDVDDRFGEDGFVVKTWFNDLDRVIGAISRGSLVILGGRPGMGKSVTAMCLILNNIINGVKCGLINYEMSTADTLLRMLSNVARKPYVNILNLIKKGEDEKIEEFYLSITAAMDKISTLPLYQDDHPKGDLSDLKSSIIKMVTIHGCRVVFVDYLGLISAPGYGDKKVLEIGEITKSLKLLAKSMGIVIVLLAQLNRLVDSRKDKRPIMSDLRDSGEIEQNADLIMFCYRDQYYYANTLKPGIMEIIVAKNRRGKIGTVDMYYEEEISLIAGLSRERD